MKIKFKYPRVIDGQEFKPSLIHEVSKSLMNHWYFKALLKSGQVSLIEEEQKVEKKKEVLVKKEEPVLSSVEVKSEPVPAVEEKMEEKAVEKPKKGKKKKE